MTTDKTNAAETHDQEPLGLAANEDGRLRKLRRACASAGYKLHHHTVQAEGRIFLFLKPWPRPGTTKTREDNHDRAV